jgi:dTDP-glucose pyrophosphorylase
MSFQRTVNMVIPMAGHGQRFRDAGYTVPKPLIEVFGRPMYSWAVDSLPLELARRLIFVALEEHLDDQGLRRDIEERYEDYAPVVIGLPEVTAGQACTVLTAREHIDAPEPLIIYNADTFCRTNLLETLPQLPPQVGGVLGVFQAPGDRWSFARLDAEGRVVETAEKRRISPWATTGLYHFTRGSDFVRHADAMVEEQDRSRGEYYVAPLYNRLLAEGVELRVDESPEVWVLGTPEELEHFLAHYPASEIPGRPDSARKGPRS